MLKNKKFVVLLLCLVILAQSAVAMAVSFPDVTKTNNSGWAYEFITELANKGIIKGYDDGTYKPENNVTYLETLSLLNGVMSPTRTEINEALTKYRTFLNSNNTPEWALEIAAVALNRGVVQESEYSRANAAKMIELGTKVSISRYDVAVFTARALELQPKSASSLTYKDAASINAAGAPLIAALIDTQVLHKDGRDGEFLPNSPIKRSEMAKMIKYAYDWTVRNPLKGPAVAIETATGTVVSSGTINNKQYLVYKPTNSIQNQSVNLDSSTKVTDRSNNTVAQKDMVNYEGASVTVSYKTVGTEKIATEIKFTTDRTGTDGQYTFKSYKESGKYYITVANTSGTTSEYETNSRTGKNGNTNFYLQDIKENAKVNLKFTNGIVTDVSMVSTQDGDYEVTSVSASLSTKYIDVRKISGGTTSTFTVNNSTIFVKDGASARYEDIGRNARIDVTSKSSNIADRVVIYSVGSGSTSNASYNFEEIRYGRIYIKNNRTGSIENYYLANNVKYLDGLSESSLRTGDPLEVRIFNNEVYEISKGSNYSGNYSGDYTFREYRGSRIYVTNNRTGRIEDFYVPNSISSRWSLKSGDQIDLRISGDDVIDIYRGSSSSSSNTTERVSFYYSNGKFEYRPSSTSSYKTVDLSLYSNNHIRIYVNGRTSDRNDLPYSGDAKITFDRSGYVIEIDVDRATSYEGTKSATVDRVGESYLEVKLDDGGAIREYRGSVWTISSFKRGDRVTVTFDRNGTITDIRLR